jgi:membrane-associated phospholipid phosphatase
VVERGVDPAPAGVGADARAGRWETRSLVLAGVLAAAALVGVTLVVVSSGSPTALDMWVVDLTSRWTDSAAWAVDLAALIGALTGAVGATVVAVCATLLLAARRRWSLALFVALSGAVGVALVELGKRSAGRLRPDGADDVIALGLDRSFPSGHSASGIYVYGAVAVLLILLATRSGAAFARWSGWALLAAGVGIGLSRIVLGVHWATDVLAGWALGSAVLLLVAAATRPDDAIPVGGRG